MEIDLKENCKYNKVRYLRFGFELKGILSEEEY